jgi:hypothetical protein
MAIGICKAVYPCDINGNTPTPPFAPNDPQAVDLYFDIDTAVQSPPQDQLDLKRDIERALFTVRRLFPTNNGHENPKFRPYYVQLLNLAVLGLVGPNAAPEVTRRAFENLTSELIDNEGPGVKNEHLQRLARAALALAVPFSILYVFLCLCARQHWLMLLLQKLDVNGQEFASFMLLWIGCFVGVVLSYGSRTTKMTLEDLVVPDSDYLLPVTRHLFAGTLTMIFGILISLGVFEVTLAGVSSKDMMSNPMIAFLIGTFFGVSELLLPGEVAKRAGSALGFKSTTS